MKKKILIYAISSVLALTSAFALASCNTDNPESSSSETEECKHTWQSEYTFDETYHWITCAECEEIKDKTQHTENENGVCTACKQYFPTEGILYDISTDSTYAAVSGYEGTATKIKIADTYNGLPVKTIYNYAFQGKPIVSVNIPDSVTQIDTFAFNGCNSLTSITANNNPAYQSIDGNLYTKDGKTLLQYAIGKTADSFIIPDNVIYIGDHAFEDCSNLISVTMGDSVTSIGEDAFNNCSSLTIVILGDNITSIGHYTFFGCSSLRFTTYENTKYLGNNNHPYLVLIGVTNTGLSSYTIHENTKIIAPSAFKDCRRIANIVIPESVTSIGGYAFSDCLGLTSVTIGNSVTFIGDGVFRNCKDLTSIAIPNGVTSIGNYAFYGCNNLTSATLGDGVTSIGNYAFSGCGNLTIVTMGNGVTSIGNYAFYNCRRLTSIVIPDSVTSIGMFAFSGCRSLTIYCEAESQPEGWDASWNPDHCPVEWGYKTEE